MKSERSGVWPRLAPGVVYRLWRSSLPEAAF
jgi:hypothetical protein